MALPRSDLPSRVLNAVVAALLVWAVIVSFVGWLLSSFPRKPQEGDACGPGYRWTHVGSPNNPDLSCERE